MKTAVLFLAVVLTATISVPISHFFKCTTREIWLSVRHSFDRRDAEVQTASDENDRDAVAEVEVQLPGNHEPGDDFVIGEPDIEVNYGAR